MKISATVRNSYKIHETRVSTDGVAQSLDVPMKSAGKGSGINGGEFLMLAIATCYCNDLYREAERLQIAINSIEVEASADFPGPGLAATNIRYSARVLSTAPDDVIEDLLRRTDSIAEIHNTIRSGVPVQLI
ncbi:OsmC family protein [Pseudoduganella sp. UC29_106]|uniref:OsmC family protein n=1 Tax=Pseudoduganella sp. UC29_106 TaxID=3374553 RepID=UPI003756857C